MSLESLQKDLVPQINHNLQTFLERFDFGQSAVLKDMIQYHMGWKDEEDQGGGSGKRIRPLLFLLCTGAFNGDPHTAMPVALGIEYLHNFTLIHDDIQDQSPFRHGRSTLWKKWGSAQAINAGDALFSIAQLATLAISDVYGYQTAIYASQGLNQVCLHLTRGQYLDIAFEDTEEVTLNRYMEMIAGKTAGLIAHSTKMGGLMTGQDEHTLALLANFGESLGLAFQIQDDYLGIWGNPNMTGKSTASDLLTRKKTLPILFGLEKCPEFRLLWDNTQLDTEHVNQLSDLLEECGSQAYTQEQTEHFTNQAYSSLRALFPQKNDYINALFDLCEILLDRKA